jgi:hypothetical protein
MLHEDVRAALAEDLRWRQPEWLLFGDDAPDQVWVGPGEPDDAPAPLDGWDYWR